MAIRNNFGEFYHNLVIMANKNQVVAMIVHIVMFKFKDENKKANMIQAKQMLENLMGAVPGLRSMDVGMNFSEEERAMDLSIITSFESKENLDAYAIHPEHLKAVDFIKEVVEYSKVVDYHRE